MKQLTFSLSMIVKNEEDVLGRCLESVKGLFDEIVITDTGSDDQTVQIARRFTDKIYSFPWIDDFSAARNFSLSKATGDYIMWLDADDVIEKDDYDGLKRLFEEIAEIMPDVVMLPYNVGFDGERVTLSYERERIIKNGIGLKFEGEVHEAIPPRGKIIHRSPAVTHRKMSQKSPLRNLRIFEKKLAETGALSPRDCYYYARELRSAGRLNEAEKWYGKCARSISAWSENRVSAQFELSELLREQGRDGEADEALAVCLTMSEPRADICCAAGKMLMEKGDLSGAAFWYKLAPLQYKKPLGGFVHADFGGIIPYLQLCVISDRLGDVREAERYNTLAAEIAPDHPSVKHNLEYFKRLH